MKNNAFIGMFIAATVLGFASDVQALVAVAPSTTSFQFKGKCTDCTGYGTAILTVQNYTPGAALDNFNLVEFTYSSNLTKFEIIPFGPLSNASLSGSVSTTPGPYEVSVSDDLLGLGGPFFNSYSDGDWSVGNTFSFSYGLLDVGTDAVWSVVGVPEPGQWALLLLGVGLTGFAMRGHRKRSAAPVSLPA